VKLYRGTSLSDSQIKTIRTGYIPKFTWLTTSKNEATRYARINSSMANSIPVLVTIYIPSSIDINKIAWKLGGSVNAIYYKTFRPLYAKTSVTKIKIL